MPWTFIENNDLQPTPWPEAVAWRTKDLALAKGMWKQANYERQSGPDKVSAIALLPHSSAILYNDKGQGNR